MRKYNYKLSNRLNHTDTYILGMYLDGLTQEQMLNYLMPDRETKYQGKSQLDKVIRKLTISLNMPFDRKKCIKNKSAILNNLHLLQAYCAEYDKFIAQQDKKLLDDGFLDMGDL